MACLRAERHDVFEGYVVAILHNIHRIFVPPFDERAQMKSETTEISCI